MSDQTLSVSELGVVVRASLEQAMPYGVWVEGEIRGINRSRNGHVYFDLVERSDAPDEPVIATVPVVLFRDARDRVNRLLKRHGDPVRMTDGVQVRIQGMVDFYPPSGRLQFRMSAIDPTYTLGVLLAEREALLRHLSDTGRLRRNAAVAVPSVPLRIALVTSIGSAAHADVTTVLERSGHAFVLIEIDTPVQGAGADRSIAAAIRTAETAGADVILLVRGGGSKTDLAVFDHAPVAEAVVESTVAVFTGIGHDTDRSIADEVAHTAHTTPTAAAQTIVSRVDEWLLRLAGHEAAVAHHARRGLIRSQDRLDHGRLRIVRAAGAALDRAGDRLQSTSTRLRRGSLVAETGAIGQLDRAAARLELAGRHGLRAADLRLDGITSRVRALDPAVALARGWSITRGPDGSVVRSIDDVTPGDVVTTRVADGTVTGTISATAVGGATEHD